MATHRGTETRRRLTATIMLAVTLASIATLMFSAPAAAAPSDYQGHWTSIDTDGSHQTLWIRGNGSTVAVTYHDDVATSACDGGPAMVSGTGRLDGDVLVMRGALTCSPGGNWVHGLIFLEFTYDAGSDTLVDFDGIVWERA